MERELIIKKEEKNPNFLRKKCIKTKQKKIVKVDNSMNCYYEKNFYNIIFVYIYFLVKSNR